MARFRSFATTAVSTWHRAWAFAAIILIGVGAEAEVLFWPARLEIPAGADPAAVAIVDLDGDGDPDLAVARRASGDVQISFGRGDGTFDPGPIYPAGGQRPAAITAADMNGDATADLVVADEASGDVAVFIGLGSGSFAGPLLSRGVPGAIAMAVGDLDGDRIPDLLVAGHGFGMLRGLGDGTFAIPDLISEAVWPRALLLADLNGDRHLDLLTGAYGLDVRLGKGDATFEPPSTYLLGAVVSGIGAGHLLGDNTLDFVVAAGEWDGSAFFVQVLEGLATGTLIPRGRSPVFLPPAALALGHLDRDRSLDVAVVGYEEYSAVRGAPREDTREGARVTRGALAVLINRGDGTFTSAIEYQAGPAPQAVAITNLDNDGAADVLVANRSGAVAVLLGTGDGRLAATPVLELAWGECPAGIALADLDRDGATDLILGGDCSSGLSVRPGIGDGTFGQPVYYPIHDGSSVAVADVNGDQRLDVVTRHANAEAAVLLGQADGSLGAPSFFPLIANVNAIAAGDLTGDRVPDLAGIAWAGLFEQGGFAVAAGRGDGSFDPPVAYFGKPRGQAAAIGEVTGDDLPDLALLFQGTQGPGLLQIERNVGDGGLAGLGVYTTGSWPSGLALGDLDGDGAADAAVANTGSGDVWVYRNRGDGRFDILDPVPAGDGPTAVAIADLSGDQVADLAVTNSGGSNVALLVGRGDGTFAPPATCYGVLRSPIALAVGPLDDQPGLDIAVSGLYAAGLSLLLSRDRDPVAVALTAFTVTAAAGGVTVRWQAVGEASVLGYHVHRAEHGATGERVRITPDLVLAGAGTVRGRRPRRPAWTA